MLKNKTTTVLEDSTREYLCKHHVVMAFFLKQDQSHKYINPKNDRLDFVKFKNICEAKTPCYGYLKCLLAGQHLLNVIQRLGESPSL